jgi:hypothetical protein
MAQGGHRNPPNNHSPVMTCIHLEPNIIHDPTTMLETTPNILAKPVTPVPQGIDVQEIVRQSILNNQGALSRLKQSVGQLNRPLYFSNMKEQPLDIGLPNNTLGDNITNPFEELILGVGGSGLPPSPLGSSPPSSREESSGKGSSSSRNLNLHPHQIPWLTKIILLDLGSIKMSWQYLDLNTRYLNIWKSGYPNSTPIRSNQLRIISRISC